MATKDYFSHTGQDGSSPSDRARRAGYSGSGVGENIAYGQRSSTQVVDNWMNSEGHRKNILNSGYSKIGIGYATSPSGKPYWVQVFGK